MTDELLERELAALLSVEPSPDFLARVRMHVESRARTRVSWLNVRWVVIAGALAVAVGTVVALRTGQFRHVDATPARVAEVLVSPSESRVVQRLLIAARGTAVVPLINSSEAAAPLLPPMPIVIEPLDVPPLVTADLELGAHQ